jgi:Cu/Ag efflux pump CusA
LVCSFKIPHFQRKIFFLLPIAAVFNFIFMLATTIAVTIAARTGRITLYGTLNGIVLPNSILESQAAALGLTNEL